MTLDAIVSERLPCFAIPRYVGFREPLPTNAMGRVLKHKLSEEGVTSSTFDLEAARFVLDRQRRRELAPEGAAASEGLA